uniref:SCAN box domain-containing protein n=1 Tax=Terrapene triunguis TaxID=2587831 RepID=A0A674JTB9_9SAUR
STPLTPKMEAEKLLNLDPREAFEYTRVKVAILDHTGISPETYRQCLRKEQYPPGARPHAVAQSIRDHCWKWLNPEGLMGPQAAEMVALEQFTQILPLGGRAWDYLSAEGGRTEKGNLRGLGPPEPSAGTRHAPPRPPNPDPRHMTPQVTAWR